jgi:Protein of unknown function, DUF547
VGCAVAGPVLNPSPLPARLPCQQLAAELIQAALAIPTAAAVARVRELAATLHACEPSALPSEARLAFWINLYNALVRYTFHCWQVRGSVVRNLRVFARAAWAIGGQRFSLDIIEHGLLRGNARVPPWKLFRTLRPRDTRLAAAVATVDPRIHFALNCGARSCPRLRVYRSEALGEQLDAATREYFATHAELDQQAYRIRLPRLMKYFRGDFGDRHAALRFAARHLDAAPGRWLLENAPRLALGYTDYDWTIVPGEPAGLEIHQDHASS